MKLFIVILYLFFFFSVTFTKCYDNCKVSYLVTNVFYTLLKDNSTIKSLQKLMKRCFSFEIQKTFLQIMKFL
jgi:hypothetical protein